MITADELRKRAELLTVVRISDEEALVLAEYLEDLETSNVSLASLVHEYRKALAEITTAPEYDAVEIAEKALGYTA